MHHTEFEEYSNWDHTEEGQDQFYIPEEQNNQNQLRAGSLAKHNQNYRAPSRTKNQRQRSPRQTNADADSGDESSIDTVVIRNRIMAKMEKTKEDEQQEELDTIKIKTMYKMVEDLNIQDRQLGAVNKKFLYLTNKQALSFDSSNMKSVFEALELPEAHFVIRLTGSTGGLACLRSHTEQEGHLAQIQTSPPEITKDDINATEARLVLFIKHCILPVAMQTGALILCAGVNDCSLAKAIAQVLGPIMAPKMPANNTKKLP